MPKLSGFILAQAGGFPVKCCRRCSDFGVGFNAKRNKPSNLPAFAAVGRGVQPVVAISIFDWGWPHEGGVSIVKLRKNPGTLGASRPLSSFARMDNYRSRPACPNLNCNHRNLNHLCGGPLRDGIVGLLILRVRRTIVYRGEAVRQAVIYYIDNLASEHKPTPTSIERRSLEQIHARGRGETLIRLLATLSPQRQTTLYYKSLDEVRHFNKSRFQQFHCSGRMKAAGGL